MPRSGHTDGHAPLPPRGGPAGGSASFDLGWVKKASAKPCKQSVYGMSGSVIEVKEV